MIALQILDIKDFMSKLLIGAAFDPFWLSEASVTTSITYNLTGSLQPDFYVTAEKEALGLAGRNDARWEVVKPVGGSIMQGK